MIEWTDSSRLLTSLNDTIKVDNLFLYPLQSVNLNVLMNGLKFTMAARKSRENPEVREFILGQVEEHPGDIASAAAKKFGFSRVTANRYLRRMVTEKTLTARGATKARRYVLNNFVSENFTTPITAETTEDTIWREKIEPLLKGLPKNVIDICQYGATEMLNNVIDHSGSDRCHVAVRINAKNIMINIRDYGIGIFEKVRRDCNLDDPRHALLELSKGKLTTDPKNHTGEGIFFTSRMFEVFTIVSGDLFFRRSMEHDDEWLIEVEDRSHATLGTLIILQIGTKATYTDTEVFKKYENDDHSFTRTHVPVRLARYGDEQLVSRSQARRVLARFNRFQEVILDFKDVPKIGQAFADEIFRVYKNEHPEVQILAIRTTPEVKAMIEHARAPDAGTPPQA